VDTWRTNTGVWCLHSLMENLNQSHWMEHSKKLWMRRLSSGRKHITTAGSLSSGTRTKKTQTPRNPEGPLLTNTLPCACYFSWHANTPELTQIQYTHMHLSTSWQRYRVNHWGNHWRPKSTLGGSRGLFVYRLTPEVNVERLSVNVLSLGP